MPRLLTVPTFYISLCEFIYSTYAKTVAVLYFMIHYSFRIEVYSEFRFIIYMGRLSLRAVGVWFTETCLSLCERFLELNCQNARQEFIFHLVGFSLEIKLIWGG